MLYGIICFEHCNSSEHILPLHEMNQSCFSFNYQPQMVSTTMKFVIISGVVMICLSLDLMTINVVIQ